jgi:hypothetical protein
MATELLVVSHRLACVHFQCDAFLVSEPFVPRRVVNAALSMAIA